MTVVFSFTSDFVQLYFLHFYKQYIISLTFFFFLSYNSSIYTLLSFSFVKLAPILFFLLLSYNL